MERTNPGESRVCGVKRQTEMPHLRVRNARQRFATDHGTAADPRANGEVQHRRLPLARPPGVFCQGSGGYIGVEPNRAAEPRNQRTDQIGVRPTILGRSEDMTPLRRGTVNLNRTERCNTDGSDRAVLLQPIAGGGNRFSRGGRRDAGRGDDLVRTTRHAQHKFGAAGLNQSKQWCAHRETICAVSPSSAIRKRGAGTPPKVAATSSGCSVTLRPFRPQLSMNPATSRLSITHQL